MKNYPKRVFFTGVPGSKWSGIAQIIESLSFFNTSDRTPEREYNHNKFSGHKGAYFGRDMEFEAVVDVDYLDQAWPEKQGTRLVKSHDWAYKLNDIKEQCVDDWIMLVYRPDAASYTWWHDAGGFDIEYPTYVAYKNSKNMLNEIQQQNTAILEWSIKQDLTWNAFTPAWVKDTFGERIEFESKWKDVLVTIVKN